VKTRLAVMVLLPILVGCGTKTANDAPAAADTSAPPIVTGLTCETDQRTQGTLDFVTSAGGAPTPEAAARVLAEPGDDIVVQGQSHSSATAYLLRSDGTAYSQLGLIVLTDDTWRVDTMESCSGKASQPGGNRG
jgi:heptaprenylglyceryl phosphate synthase